MGYHLRPIKVKGTFGSLEKIEEELDELREAIEQDNKILIHVELSDLYGAIDGFIKKNYPEITMDDLKKMCESTHRAFSDGSRK